MAVNVKCSEAFVQQMSDDLVLQTIKRCAELEDVAWNLREDKRNLNDEICRLKISEPAERWYLISCGVALGFPAGAALALALWMLA